MAAQALTATDFNLGAIRIGANKINVSGITTYRDADSNVITEDLVSDELYADQSSAIKTAIDNLRALLVTKHKTALGL